MLQEVFFVAKDNYEAEKAAYNKTIQHTVANALDGVTPERVTDIVVEEEEEEGGRVRNHAHVSASVFASNTNSVILKYKITVFDPVMTVKTLRTQLVQAAQEGRMDTNLRFFAAQFGATGLNNGTFAVPQVTNAAVQRDSSSQLTGVQVALVVICVFVGLVLLATISWFAFLQRRSQQPSPVQERSKVDLNV